MEKCRGRSKRKADNEECEFLSKKPMVCILHFENFKCESFTFLSDSPNPQERLQYLQDIQKLRLSQASDSKHRMESVCQLIPDKINVEHGYHRDCYQWFTKNIDRLRDQGSQKL